MSLRLRLIPPIAFVFLVDLESSRRDDRPGEAFSFNLRLAGKEKFRQTLSLRIPLLIISTLFSTYQNDGIASGMGYPGWLDGEGLDVSSRFFVTAE
jgi:hypothetical protein